MNDEDETDNIEVKLFGVACLIGIFIFTTNGGGNLFNKTNNYSLLSWNSDKMRNIPSNEALYNNAYNNLGYLKSNNINDALMKNAHLNRPILQASSFSTIDKTTIMVAMGCSLYIMWCLVDYIAKEREESKKIYMHKIDKLIKSIHSESYTNNTKYISDLNDELMKVNEKINLLKNKTEKYQNINAKDLYANFRDSNRNIIISTLGFVHEFSTEHWRYANEIARYKTASFMNLSKYGITVTKERESLIKTLANTGLMSQHENVSEYYDTRSVLDPNYANGSDLIKREYLPNRQNLMCKSNYTMNSSSHKWKVTNDNYHTLCLINRNEVYNDDNVNVILLDEINLNRGNM